MKYFNKKSVALIFVILIIFLVAPKPTFAQAVTFESNPLTWLSNIATSGASTATKIQQVLEWAFKLATEVLKRQLLNSIVDQTVAWIQGGGNPKFITDWPGFFRDAVDQAGGRFIQGMELTRLCTPFKPRLQAAFIPIPTFSERAACTISDVGTNIDDFLKDFRNGGWLAWQEMVLKPQNNIYGAYLMAWDQYEIEKSAAAKAAESEAQAGKGFLGVKECLEPYVGKIDPNRPCTKSQVITPGAVVGDTIAKAIGSDIDFIVNSDDLKAYTSAITNAILNRMLKEGVGLLHTTLSGSGGIGGGVSSSTQVCSNLFGTEIYNDCINAVQSGASIETLQKNYQISLIDLISLNYQNQLLDAKKDMFVILSQTLETVSELGSCLASICPGLTQVQDATTTLNITNQISDIQLQITNLKVGLHQAEKDLENMKENRLFKGIRGQDEKNLENIIESFKDSIAFLNQRLYCLNLSIDPDPDLAKILDTASIRADILDQIKKVQRDILDITALKNRLQKAKDEQETIDIASLKTQINETQKLISDTQNETNQKQHDLSLYQQRLSSCQRYE